MLIIRTHTYNPLTLEFWKWLARAITRKQSGPQAVLQSLVRGLRSKQIPYYVDPLTFKPGVTIVLSGPHALAESLQKKQAGLIPFLLAGPTVFTNSPYSNVLLQNPALDIILAPSAWAGEYYAKEGPAIRRKVHVWASGVQQAKKTTRDGPLVVYNKLKDSKLLDQVLVWCKQRNYPVLVLTYGHFPYCTYLKSLKSAPCLIYIGASETQGIAQQEAWAHDVPTYVYSPSEESSPTRKPEVFIEAPYLTPEAGSIFNTTADLDILIKDNDKITPQDYCNTHFTDTVSTETLLTIIDKANKNRHTVDQ